MRGSERGMAIEEVARPADDLLVGGIRGELVTAMLRTAGNEVRQVVLGDVRADQVLHGESYPRLGMGLQFADVDQKIGGQNRLGESIAVDLPAMILLCNTVVV